MQQLVELSKKDWLKENVATNSMKVVPYTSTRGPLIYDRVARRLDIAHAMRVVSIFMANLGKAH